MRLISVRHGDGGGATGDAIVALLMLLVVVSVAGSLLGNLTRRLEAQSAGREETLVIRQHALMGN